MILQEKKKFIIILVFLFLLVGCSSNKTNNVKLETGYKLGTVVKIKIYDQEAKKLIKESFELLDEVENKMSSHIAESEINKINRQAGQQVVKVSADTYYVLKKALKYARLSQGVFDPTVGPLVRLWRIGTKEEQIPQEKELKKRLKLVDYSELKLKSEGRVFLTKEGMKLDVGGIAKGYAADKIIDYLKEKDVQSAYIDIGGNVSVLGSKPDNDFWQVGIQDPKKDRGKVLAAIGVKDKTIVTSGNYERYFMKNGKRYHHLLNPNTGYPARKDIISATVVTNNSLQADALSTAVYILGSKEGLSLINKLDDVEALLVTRNNRIYLTSGLKGQVEILAKNNYQVRGQ